MLPAWNFYPKHQWRLTDKSLVALDSLAFKPSFQRSSIQVSNHRVAYSNPANGAFISWNYFRGFWVRTSGWIEFRESFRYIELGRCMVYRRPSQWTMCEEWPFWYWWYARWVGDVNISFMHEDCIESCALKILRKTGCTCSRTCNTET